MSIEVQLKLKENPNYIKFLRENSNWYKMLNRNPNNFTEFKNQMIKKYKLTKADRLSKTLEMIEMVEKLLSVIK